MLTSQLDRLVPTLLQRQIRDSRFVDPVETWDRYVPTTGAEPPDALVGAYWDPIWFAASGPGRIRSVDTVNICQYLDLMSYAAAEPRSAYYRAPCAIASARAALDFCARRIISGRPLTNACFNFGLIALGEAVVRLRGELSAELLASSLKAIRLAASDLYGIYRAQAKSRPPGTHNHQFVTGHAMLQAGLALDDRELARIGERVLLDNTGYFNEEGCGHEHDRKYEMVSAGSLVRAYELTGDGRFLEAALPGARYGSQFVSLAGELIELTSGRPDCAGDLTFTYALYTYLVLGSEGASPEAPPFRAIADRMIHYVRQHQRADGLWPGFLYAMDPELRLDKMDPFYMTGYGLLPLMWANDRERDWAGGPLPDMEVVTETERAFSFRKEDFHVLASGWDRRQRASYGRWSLYEGPADLLVIDAGGPGVWGLACRAHADGKDYGDIGGFTPRMELCPEAWRAERSGGGWRVTQQLRLLDEDGAQRALLRAEMRVRDGECMLALEGSGEGITGWTLGPNLRSAVGPLSLETDEFALCPSELKEQVPFAGPLRLCANGRALEVSAESGGDLRLLVEAPRPCNRSLRHRLVPGDVVGLRARAEGSALKMTWRFTRRG